MAPGHHERLSVVFATSDDGALTDLGQELAPAFFINIAPDSDALFRTLSEQAPEIVVIDLDTIVPRGADVFEWTASVRAVAAGTLLIIISRTPLKSARQRAKKAGADEFLLAPVDFAELREFLLEAGEERRARTEAQQLREGISQKTSFCGMIGGSEAMQRVYEALRRVAPSNTTVMLRGESGTGKELAARAIVSLSPRREGPFISVNCAALPETLMESELFGHEKGSFTGAHATRPGQVELADGGTLFLDEIGSLGLALQSKLLRVLQDRAVQRIGGKSPRKIDFRLITATNDDLEDMVKKGQFREDLYYRICVVPIQLPPLREREGDVPL
ncbi:MAG TPA: sigma-54 dependent transcriptional regulator, partial [Acidobacteriaceae bacterium]|nr:sigma-54 dependent transcriptional regulator [Acidobacteriaceae bacterium]